MRMRPRGLSTWSAAGGAALGYAVAARRCRRMEQRLVATAAAAEAAGRELEAFSCSVAHELRAPLRAIDAYSQLALDSCGESLGEEGRAYLMKSRAACRRMGCLIDDLLSLSRVARAAARMQRVELCELARRGAERLRRRHPHRPVEFVVAERMVDRGDPDLLRLALEHLLANAWKATAGRPRPRVEFGRLPSPPRPYFVRDNGTGFDMAFSGNLFQPFNRLDPAADPDGRGIGLALVRRVVERHRGRVWAEGAPGGGATFYFTLWSGDPHG